MPLTETDKRVNKGIGLLNKEYPNWKEKINWDKLDMYSPKYCILGQLYEDYILGLDTLKLFDSNKGFYEDQKYGFSLSSTGETYQQLTNYWKDLSHASK